MPDTNASASFADFCGVMDTLLGENGCPWDKEQTHESLKPYLLEESYEVAEAIDQRDPAALCEELGDVLMQIVFHGKLAERTAAFTLTDVIEGIKHKMISRHSHIFGEDKAATAAEVEVFWETNKNNEKKYQNSVEMLRAVPKTLPALMRAEKVLKRAKIPADTGVYFAEARALLASLESAVSSEKPALSEENLSLYSQFGELLFILAKISVILEINAEFSLTNGIEAFINSFSKACL